MQNQTVASPSLRVHRVFNRLGIVLVALCLIPTGFLLLVCALTLVTGNLSGAAGSFFYMFGWVAFATAVYALCRAIGWVIAGATDAR